MSQRVHKITPFNAVTVSAGTSEDSPIYEVNSIKPIGFFSIQLVVSGAGTVKVDLLASLNESTFVEYSTLMEDVTAGDYIDNFNTVVCMRFKLRVTETGGASDAVVTVTMGIQ